MTRATLSAFLLSAAAVAPAIADSQWLPVAGSSPEALLAPTLEAAGPDGATIRVAVPGVHALQITAENGNPYTQLAIPGCGATADQFGRPELPFKGFFLEVPYGVHPSVSIDALTWRSLGAGWMIYPLQPPSPDSHPQDVPEFQIDLAAYAVDAFAPAQPVVIAQEGFIRGRRVLFVQIFPVQYNPAAGELRAAADLQFRIRFAGAADPAGELEKQRVATPEWDQFASGLILNYEPVQSPAWQAPDGGGNGADYLIIVADTLYNEVLPLAEWKHRKGYATRVAKTSETGLTATQIQAYILNAYQTWTPAPSFVLLVGDQADVPALPYSSYVSDQGYACVQGGDYWADLTIGRLPVHTTIEAANVVGKLLQYDQTPDPGDWYHHFLAAAYFQDDDNNGIADRWFMETAMTVYDFLIDELDFTGHTALNTTRWPLTYTTYHFRSSHYPHRTTVNQVRWGVSAPGYPDPVPTWIVQRWTSAAQATADITTAINAGVGIVQHRDHGGNTGWGDPPYSNGNVAGLTNGVKTPVIFSLNCLTGSFHSGECFCEAFMKKTPGGSVGIVGATTVSYSGYNDLICHGIYTCFWPQYDPTHTNATYPYSWRPAQALNYGKYYMGLYEGSGSTTAAEVYMFHYFGDPEMMLRTTRPQALQVRCPHCLGAGYPIELSITVSAAGAPLPGALVALTNPAAGVFERRFTNAAGVVAFTGLNVPEGDYSLVVTARDAQPMTSVVPARGVFLGDLNCDGAFNFDDINPFVLALSSLEDYMSAYPNCNWYNADCNRDGRIDFYDINAFVDLLPG
ncbi:MAG: C25 family cysteine peptidase [Planctomycetota bacterium]